ncbi:mechanosensitive ion channel protein MscS [Burkholderia territorii]|uniref:mechanosensitive ion channel family protein n=1 Tax=Burkholderia territorii TaxID=1503055 RepID=UPI0007567D00|nr:mechanosensitive ion channel family protein [Burkholderia territorii]AOI67229.1 mechanosensitive ion channel protein MscS [Burkholderia territorii]KVG53782.1 mechanosensitive ion channel protein MscS [Burkholderia territorii]KVL51637.1 mechanosensitive ion channel protein MscS [Burkholderia territorii]KVQ39011.1 mechanosensitive ion channel protein MscS [Burkholderia territorii]KWA23723.1 mechanosensitive ion channel protein MscS [Burkholderia territorii]
MPNLSATVAYGAPIVLADLVAWRLLGHGRSKTKAAWRCASFAALTYALFSTGVSPLAVPPSPDRFDRLAIQAIAVAWWLQGALVFSLMLDHLLLPRAWRNQRLFHDIAAAAVFGAAAVAALGYVLGLPLSGVVATSGAVAVILGLALQNTLNDVFSGLVLNTTQPFRLGDTVSIGELEGRIVESNWRATKMINGLGNLVVVPNSAAAKATIVNLSEPVSVHGVTLTIEIDPGVRPAVVVDALDRAAASSLDVLASPAPVSVVKAFRTNSIEYELVCYVDALQKKVEVRNRLYDLAHRHLAAADVALRPLAGTVAAHRPVSRGQCLLRAVDLFRQLDDADLAVLADALASRVFHKGEVIYASNADARLLTIVGSGVASVFVPGAAGDIEVRRMAPGDAIGQSVVLAGTQLHASVYAVTAVTAYQLSSRDLSPLIAKKPELGRLMCESLTEHIATEERMMIPPAAKAHASFNLFEWLEKEMKRLHASFG